MPHKYNHKAQAETNISYWIPKEDFDIESVKSYIEIITESGFTEKNNQHVYTDSGAMWEENQFYIYGDGTIVTVNNTELSYNFDPPGKLNSFFFRLTFENVDSVYHSGWEFELKQTNTKIIILDETIINTINDYDKETGEVFSFGKHNSLEDVIFYLFNSEDSWIESSDEANATITIDLKEVIPDIETEMSHYLEDSYSISEFFGRESSDTPWTYTEELAGDLLSGILTHGNKKSLSWLSSFSINNIIEILKNEQEYTENPNYKNQVKAVKDITLDYFKSFSKNVFKGVETSHLYFLYFMWCLTRALEDGDIEEEIKASIINNNLPAKLSDWEF